FDFSSNTLQVLQPGGDTLNLETDQVLVAVGRKPNTQGWNLEALNLDMNGSAIKIDHRCQTSMRNVYAIGDLSGEPMLAHRAMAQGE
ncbi:dihydrolipoyl dehydrogenase, partial [Pseudomonas sp. GW247-3R2A]